MATSITFTKYLNSVLNEEKMKELLKHIKHDSDEMMKLPEGVLMESGSMHGRKMTIWYSSYIIIMALMYALLPLTPVILDVIKPLNQTREKKFMFEAEYFVDDKKYYYCIMLVEYVSATVTISILVAVDTMFMVYVQHACTLFTIISNRLKYLHIMEDGYIDEERSQELGNKYSNRTYTKTERYIMYQKFRYAIKLHKNVLSYSKLLQSSFSTALAIQVVLNVLAVSFTGMMLILNAGNVDDVTRYVAFITGQLVHLFFLCFSGQRLLDYSSQSYTEICSSMWYLFPINVQSMYQFLLMRCSNPCKITAGKFAIMGMETYLSVTQTAVSYFTVLTSVR